MTSERSIILMAAGLAGVAIVAILNLVLPGDTTAARLLIDKSAEFNSEGQLIEVTRIISVQTFLWLAFMVGLGDVGYRFFWCRKEEKELLKTYLPEAPDVLLEAKDLVPIYRKVRRSDQALFVPRLISRVVLQFQSAKSVDRANSLLNSSLDLFLHEVELRYGLLRFLVWLIPSLGFLGTVVGIAGGLNLAAVQYKEMSGEIDLASVTNALSVAFYTTWLGLLMAAVLVFLNHLAQTREEGVVNRAGQYCLDHLINKLYERTT
jgi:biopolymer transport protein ExbB/TolQ